MTPVPIPETLRQLTGTILHEREDYSFSELQVWLQQYVVEAKEWLARKALDTDPDPLPEFRLLAEEVVKSLRAPGKDYTPREMEAMNDGLEVVRRAERALAVSIKAGQDAGLISSRNSPLVPTGPKREYSRGDGTLVAAAALVVKPRDMRTMADFYPHAAGKGGGSIGLNGRRFAELTETEFDKVLQVAREQPGLLTRVKVLRVIDDLALSGSSEYPSTLAGIIDLAGRGSTSEQIAEHLGVTPEYVRSSARAQHIAIAADEIRGRGRRVFDPMRIVRETAIGLEGTVSALDFLDLSALDSGDPELAGWTASIQRSLRLITKMNQKLKEIVNA